MSSLAENVASPPSKILFWVLGLILAAVLGAAAAHAPERVKLIGPFAIALGLVTGAALGRIGREFAVGSSWKVVCGFVLLVLIAQVGNSWLTYREVATRSRNLPQQQKLPFSLEYTAEQLQEMSPKSREIAEEGRFIDDSLHHRQTFSQFQLLRLLPLSPVVHGWSPGRALTIWILEVVCATAAGGYVGCHMARPHVAARPA